MIVKPLQMVGRKHPALNAPAQPSTSWSREKLQVLAERMRGTLQRQRGYALAAQQVGAPVSLIVFSNGAVVRDLEIVEHSDRQITSIEGCLSLPGRWYEVPRFQRVAITGLTLAGEPSTAELADIDARVVQHEADHLAGLLLRGRYEEIRHPERYQSAVTP